MVFYLEKFKILTVTLLLSATNISRPQVTFNIIEKNKIWL